jgi:hypothetical protein
MVEPWRAQVCAERRAVEKDDVMRHQLAPLSWPAR